ncbi:Chemotaxis protein CheX, a CheY~P-specific phosphatase [Geoalkalibacter ferrihydriticus]|uniref:Chemotaxis protein CheX n=2 Tax=Geoalkalibacter ferrihydriticus TaxID=392333 RepID=A0A0C2HF15_9BACT|nr:chemotaxis protein CheX [Geoalkalibacter ferrihydriticus]KIH75561.1 chemotaxis protein CheX [Geoalkalibacter ferrihydriticus DSM 17813]SDL31918.1 Chemotaxis protein CheX, a CheY~P-specific phosphatase [Geoalkalibacter ferrihydriticus]
MAVKFFGQFLVERGVVNPQKLLEAIDLQERTNLKFGEMALDMGLINEADVERVHDAQRGEDLRFGDMAVKLGILSSEQMQQILTRQKNNHLYIGEALVKIGALDAERVTTLLDEFKVDQAPYLATRLVIPEGVSNPQFWEMAADLTYKMLTRVANLSFRPGPCVLAQSFDAKHVAAAMDFSGSLQGRYLLSVTSGVQQAIARAILKEADVSAEPKEVLEDTLMEFINIVCGNIVAKGAQLGHTLEINPPVIFAESRQHNSVPAEFCALCFPLYLADGEEAELSLWIPA